MQNRLREFFFLSLKESYSAHLTLILKFSPKNVIQNFQMSHCRDFTCLSDVHSLLRQFFHRNFSSLGIELPWPENPANKIPLLIKENVYFFMFILPLMRNWSIVFFFILLFVFLWVFFFFRFVFFSPKIHALSSSNQGFWYTEVIKELVWNYLSSGLIWL